MPVCTIFSVLVIRQPRFFHSSSLEQSSAARARTTQDGQVAAISHLQAAGSLHPISHLVRSLSDHRCSRARSMVAALGHLQNLRCPVLDGSCSGKIRQSVTEAAMPSRGHEACSLSCHFHVCIDPVLIVCLYQPSQDVPDGAKSCCCIVRSRHTLIRGHFPLSMNAEMHF